MNYKVILNNSGKRAELSVNETTIEHARLEAQKLFFKRTGKTIPLTKIYVVDGYEIKDRDSLYPTAILNHK